MIYKNDIIQNSQFMIQIIKMNIIQISRFMIYIIKIFNKIVSMSGYFCFGSKDKLDKKHKRSSSLGLIFALP